MKNLASIQKVINIEPIEGADNIVKATVLGWQIVVKKDEFKVGDLACYIQIDTICPETEYFEFLRDRKFRVKTIKLRKTLSQGLLVPLSVFGISGKEGEDITEKVGVKKFEKTDNNPERYEKPRVPKTWRKRMIYYFKYNYLYKWFPKLRPKSRSGFPTNLVSITDEERIQNCPQVLEQYKGKEFVVSHKLDGSSITIIHDKGKFRICSRRFELHDKKNDWYRVFTDTNFQLHIKELVRYYGTKDIIVQGECIGKFNGNHHGLDKDEIRLFNIYVKGKRLKQDEFLNTCHILNIPHCPLYKIITLNHTLEEILKISEMKDPINSRVEGEGLVWRCVEDNLSFKVINNKYLLKHE